jgi:hypothetical protein
VLEGSVLEGSACLPSNTGILRKDREMNLNASMIFWAVLLFIALPLAVLWTSKRGTTRLKLRFTVVTILTSWIGVIVFLLLARKATTLSDAATSP